MEDKLEWKEFKDLIPGVEEVTGGQSDPTLGFVHNLCLYFVNGVIKDRILDHVNILLYSYVF